MTIKVCPKVLNKLDEITYRLEYLTEHIDQLENDDIYSLCTGLQAIMADLELIPETQQKSKDNRLSSSAQKIILDCLFDRYEVYQDCGEWEAAWDTVKAIYEIALNNTKED